MVNKRMRNAIVSLVGPKAKLRKQVEANITEGFETLCSVLQQMADEYSEALGPDVAVRYERRASHVALFTLDADVLVFVQLTDVFNFDRDNQALKTPYVKEDAQRAAVGIVNVYNFMTDSFKYDRDEDMGYLVARIFVNAEGAFFVEGKRQRGVGVDHFGEQKVDADAWRRFAETALKYAAESDALVPPYEMLLQADMATLKGYILASKTKTAKRLGFGFKADDVR
ncbi:MAG: hypothetical protein ACI35N_03410 [Marinilabiliaceae bacterium]